MFALPVILIFTILLITIQIPIICTLYYSQNYMLKMLSIKLSINMQSHPLRVRGLKLEYSRAFDRHFFVASFTGAWIETATVERGLDSRQQSHPLRVRGLKLVFQLILSRNKQSHPLRVRGLKPIRTVSDRTDRQSHPLRVRGLKHRLFLID